MKVSDILASLSKVQSKTESVLNKPVVYTAILMFLVIFGSLAAPALPLTAAPYFENTYVRLFFFFFVAYIATQNPLVALVLALVFVVALQYLSRKKMAAIGGEIIKSRNDVLASVESVKMPKIFAKNGSDSSITPHIDHPADSVHPDSRTSYEKYDDAASVSDTESVSDNGESREMPMFSQGLGSEASGFEDSAMFARF